MAPELPPWGRGIEHRTGFEVLGNSLALDTHSALQLGREEGINYPQGPEPLDVFRSVLRASVREIEEHPRGSLLRRFLVPGPYDRPGPAPSALVDNSYQADSEVASAVSFIHAHVVRSFQGAIAELLAAPACARIVRHLQDEGKAPGDASIYVGDLVKVGRHGRTGKVKGADIHVLVEGAGKQVGTVTLIGVGEVKSYHQRDAYLKSQLEKHVTRLPLGLIVNGRSYPRFPS